MKAYRIVILALVGFISAVSVFAENDGIQMRDPNNWSAYSYRNVVIEKIYPHRLGYVISYRNGPSGFAKAYLPLEWFSNATEKGEIIRLQSGATWPYLSIFYKDGVFSHVRLHIRNGFNHESWGRLPVGVDIDAEFNVEEVVLEY